MLYGLVAMGLMACGGGGCGGCGESCGVAPIPGGFPIEQRVPNSAQVRLTEEGINFLEENAATLVGLFLEDGIFFPVPRTTGREFSTDFDICRSENCAILGDISSLTIDPVAPNRLRVHIRVRLTATDLERNPRPIDVRVNPPVLPAGNCTIDVETRNGSRDYVGLIANLALVEETEAARRGYTKIVVEDVGLAPGEDLENPDVTIGGCSGYAWLLNLFKGTLINQLQNQIGDLLDSALDEQLCTRQGEYGCPTGTHAVPAGADPEAVCRYAPSESAACVPMLLGTDGQGDLGAAFLGSVSPGTHAPGQFLLAAGGDGEAVNNGMSLFFYGGFLGTSRDFTTIYPHNPCVPRIEPPPIPTIPRIATFRGNTVPGLAEPPHVGIGLSESFLNHAGYGAFDAGLLCIGAGTPLSQQLSTGLFSLLIPSLNRITFPERSAPLAVMLRPQRPPVFTIGMGTGEADPLLSILLEELQVDFYVWSNDRFVRFMTYQADLTLALNLTVADGEIVPMVVGLDAENSSVTNQSNLLTEEPGRLATIIQDVLTGFASMAFGDLGGFALPDLSGIELQVQEGGVRGIEESGEAFLGIFARLNVPAPMPLSAPVETRMTLGELELDPYDMRFETWREGTPPRLNLHLDASGPEGVDFEYSVRVDGQPWSAWTRDPNVVVEDPMLRFQARHVVEARARVVGEKRSVDLTPAIAEVLVDIEPPLVELAREGGRLYVEAWDLLGDDALQYRWRPAGADFDRESNAGWSDWARISRRVALPVVGEVEVEVRDDAGNVGSVSSPLIRGVPNPSGGGGCDCSVEGPGHAPGTALAFLGALFFLARRPRPKTGRSRKGPPRGRSFRRSGGKRAGVTGASSLFLGLALPMALAVAGCDCGTNPAPPDGEVPMDGEMEDAGPPGPLDPGLLATHLDMVALADGTLVLSGYSVGSPPSAVYGDLVVGTWNGTSVDWEIIDGVPDMPPTRDPSGWRGGIAQPGDDVGTFSSMVNDGSNLVVAYHDRTNGALKVASGTVGGAWSITTVDADGYAGAYASLTRTSTGYAVSYLAISSPSVYPGRPISGVRVATASSPTGPWTVTEVTSGEMPCRPAFCGGTAACLETGNCTMDAGGAATLPDNYVEDLPPAIGLHTALAATPTGLALVYYSRAEGNVYGVTFEGGTWGEPFLIDGYGRGDPDAGDSGLHASLVVDGDGVWHVAYVDGAEEVLRYARIEGGVVTREDVDDGETEDSTDGRHVVGDDASIVVTPSGEVRIAYQDATRQDARLARKAAGATEWTVSVLDDADSTGYFTTQALVGSASSIAFWYRQEMSASRSNGVRVRNVE
ncbi:MAG: hypothetical protein KF901_25055 [Myxococcales bacterium]|nr:hypothetical protein [Myxococcales bacterium]